MTTFCTTSVEELAERCRIRDAAPALHEALNHPLLNELLDLVEDGADLEARAVAALWMNVRDAALAKARPSSSPPARAGHGSEG